MVSIFNEINLKDCIDRYIFKQNSKIVEIYGENHNKRLNKINSYSNMIPVISESNPLVLVEHSSLYCNLDNISSIDLQNMLGFGGSETIFLKLKEINFKKLSCIDNRLEMGFMPMFIKKQITNVLDKKLMSKIEVIDKEFLEIVHTVMKSTMIVLGKDVENYFKKSIYSNIYDIFSNIIKIQVKLMFLVFKLSSRDSSILSLKIDKKESYGSIFTKNMYNIVENLEKLGSLLVDINILSNVVKSRSKRIIIYAGTAHTDRIYSILNQEDNINHYLGKTFSKKYELQDISRKTRTPVERSMYSPIILSAEIRLEKSIIDNLEKL